MKKILIIFAILVAISYNATRTDTGTIIEVTDNGTTIWTSDLNVWEVTDQIGEKGDECTVIFDTMGTESIYDDAIVDIIIK